jgi:trimeric autotransporter adhesin
VKTPIQTSIERSQKDLLAKPGRPSICALTLIAVAVVCLELLPTAYAVRPTPSPSPTPSPGENLGNGNSAAENVQALISLTTGVNNTATGFQALFNNTTGSNNTATGAGTLFANTGDQNTATGTGALLSNTTGENNTATGASALQGNTTGHGNTANGYDALRDNVTGNNNTAMGYRALSSNVTGSHNVALGINALATSVDANVNTAIGYAALQNNTEGVSNTAVGYATLFGNTSGDANIAIGDRTGYQQTTGSNNIYIGYDIEGTPGENNSCYIGSIFGQTSSVGTPVYVNLFGKLGTLTSSRRFKEDIKPMNNTSEALFGLKPVTFRYKKEIDPQGIPQFGLIAEDVAQVNPQLVVRDKEGKVNTVRYEQINAMLLNEFRKEHKKVEEQEVTISDLKKDLGVLTAQLKEQAAEIQKVSAQLEMRRPLTRVARSYP